MVITPSGAMDKYPLNSANVPVAFGLFSTVTEAASVEIQLNPNHNPPPAAVASLIKFRLLVFVETVMV
jgi:hypothetical protein